MRHRWRLLRDGITDAHHHFAVEEALIRLVDEDLSPPTLRLRQVRRAVFVGVFQDTWSEVDVDFCQKQGIQIVRRANAGGAVYHDVGSFCYSAFFPRRLFPHSQGELYRLFARPIILTCADYGLGAHFKGRNDVLIGRRKIYGSAQITWYDTFVQSGTFLVNMDFDVMDRALTPPPLKFAGKSAKSVKDRVTSLGRELGREISVDEVMSRFTRHFCEALDVELLPGDLSAEEDRLALELLRVKYGTDEWNMGSQQSYDVTVAAKATEGIVLLSANMSGSAIQEARIRGDFLGTDQETVEALQRTLIGCRLDEAQARVQASGLPPEMKATLIQLLGGLGQEA
jgi:lipoate-protein ligase A